jgi:hypothetical protein
MQQLNVIPYPAVVDYIGPGTFDLPRTPTISCSAALQWQATYLQAALQQRFGTPSNILQLSQEASRNDQAPISLQLVDDLPALWPFRWSDEGYQLVCSEQGISISALTPTGAFYGVQTLLQALSVSEQQQGLCLPHTQVGVPSPRMR